MNVIAYNFKGHLFLKLCNIANTGSQCCLLFIYTLKLSVLFIQVKALFEKVLYELPFIAFKQLLLSKLPLQIQSLKFTHNSSDKSIYCDSIDNNSSIEHSFNNSYL